MDPTSIDQLTSLVMQPSVRAELRGIAIAWAEGDEPVNRGARDLLVSITLSERAGKDMVRLRCSAAAIEFIREQAPEIAQRWPSVFDDKMMLTVELEVREVRALVHAANMMSEVWTQVLVGLPDDPLIGVLSGTPPLQSGAMKLELAMTVARQEL